MLDRTIEPSQVSEAILENSEAVKTPAMAVNAEPPATVFKDVIFYDDAVEEAKEILKQFESGQMRLGELAHKLESRYGDQTLERFAADVASCTLERYRSVYRAWLKIPAPGPKLRYAVARELATHPDRAEIVKRNPEITKRQARSLMRQYREELETATAPSADNGDHAALTSRERSLLQNEDDIDRSRRNRANTKSATAAGRGSV
jgi:hypothetical protein